MILVPVDSQTQKRIVHLAEFEACKCSAGLQNTVGFFENIGDGRAIADTKRNGIQVIRVVRKLRRGQFLSVGFVE